jgi:hypothetical protein
VPVFWPWPSRKCKSSSVPCECLRGRTVDDWNRRVVVDRVSRYILLCKGNTFIVWKSYYQDVVNYSYTRVYVSSKMQNVFSSKPQSLNLAHLPIHVLGRDEVPKNLKGSIDALVSTTFPFVGKMTWYTLKFNKINYQISIFTNLVVLVLPFLMVNEKTMSLLRSASHFASFSSKSKWKHVLFLKILL